jgi:hypothetical protein
LVTRVGDVVADVVGLVWYVESRVIGPQGGASDLIVGLAVDR